MEENSNPHILFFPFPIQGHVSPMLKLAELLSHANLHITFVNTESIHARLINNSPALDRLSKLPSFRFTTVPDGLTRDDEPPLSQLLQREESMRSRCREPYRRLLLPDHQPPVSCVVADGMVRVALEVPEEMGIPVMLFRTSSACSIWAYYSIPELIKQGELPFPEDADMDQQIQGVAGMKDFLRCRDLPGLLRHAKSTKDPILEFLNTVSTNIRRAKALILNTFEGLEAPVLSHIRTVCPITYTLGPLHLLVRNSNPDHHFPSFWQEDRSCITWLNHQPNKSVVYASFGSITIMSREKLLEFWHGLVDSGQRFLWVTRPDMIQGTTEEGGGTTPVELEEGTRGRGCLVSWAPQEEVLAHPAVGCFLTHSGWNSTLESIVAGVPMICWPFFADQQVNSRFVGEIWKIGVDMKDVCERDTITRMIRKVMMDDAEELRTSIGALSDIAKKSVEEKGSSYMNFQKLIQHIKSFSIKGSKV